MKEIKFRAIISPVSITKCNPENQKAIIHFNLQDLVNPKALFSIRELLIPWIREGNIPDEFTGLIDKNGREIYSGDILVTNNDGSDGADEWSSLDYGKFIVAITLKDGICIECNEGYNVNYDEENSIFNIKYMEIIGDIHER